VEHRVTNPAPLDLDYATALQHIERLDLVEEWLPDVLRHEDELSDRARVLAEAQTNVKTMAFARSIGVEVPKRRCSHEPVTYLP